jgi:hypothetical protein
VTVIEQLGKHSRVENADDERCMGHGILVTLRKGWTFDPTRDKRVAAADTFREAWTMVRHAHPFAGPWQDSQTIARAAYVIAPTTGGN